MHPEHTSNRDLFDYPVTKWGFDRMPRASLGPRLWLDKQRQTWTIIWGRNRYRTGIPADQRDLALKFIQKFSDEMGLAVGGPAPEIPVDDVPESPKSIYVIGFGPYVKIGITVDVGRRLPGLQTPEAVQVYGVLSGTSLLEKLLHARFAAYRLNGEWFRKEGELASWIEAQCPFATKL